MPAMYHISTFAHLLSVTELVDLPQPFSPVVREELSLLIFVETFEKFVGTICFLENSMSSTEGF